MDTRSLSYFIAVAEDRNIGRAAQRLHISPSALTRQMQSLEEEFGVPLFVRTVSGVQPTTAGESLLLHARNIRAELELAKRDALRHEKELHGQLHVGVYGSAIFNVIPRILSQFASANPGVELVLHNARKDQQIESLRQGRILIAFDRFLPEEPGLTLELVCREQTYIALHKDHPLTDRPVLCGDDLRNEAFMGAHDKSRDAELVRYFGFAPKIAQRVDDLLMALAMVGCGSGITLAPGSIQTLQIPNVVYRPLSGVSVFPFELQCLYRSNEQSPLLHSLLATAREVRASLAAEAG